MVRGIAERVAPEVVPTSPQQSDIADRAYSAQRGHLGTVHAGMADVRSLTETSRSPTKGIFCQS